MADTTIASRLGSDFASKRVGRLVIGLRGGEGRHWEGGRAAWDSVLGHYGLTKGVGGLGLGPGAEGVLMLRLLLLLRRLSNCRWSDIQQTRVLLLCARRQV